MGAMPKKEGGITRYHINPEKFNPLEPDKQNSSRDYIRTLQEARKIVNEITDYIGLGAGDWWYKRIDFAFDSEEDYDRLYVLNNCLMRTFAAAHKVHNNYCATGGDLRRRSLKAKASRRTLEIYNKRIETNKAFGTWTRVEFRFTRLGEGKNKDPAFVLNKVMSDLKKEIEELPDWFSTMEEKQRAALYREYVSYMKRKHTITSYGKAAEQEIATLFVPKVFRGFVQRYQDEIITNSVLKALYEKAGGKHFWQWRNANKGTLEDIRLITKKDVEQYCEVLKKSLEDYTGVTSFVTMDKNDEAENALTIWDFDGANLDSALIDTEQDRITNPETTYQDRAERRIASATGEPFDGGMENIGLYTSCGVALNDIAEYLS